MNSNRKKFDVFLSYKSQDNDFVQRLKRDLQLRGIKVWLDKDEIRPGDLFVEALENGLETSKTVVIVITPESVNSGWVRRERARALSLATSEGVQLIPILFGNVELPGFLADLQYIDFRDLSKYAVNINRLIWPGITGKEVLFVGVAGIGGAEWDRLREILYQSELELYDIEDIDRVKWPGFERSDPYKNGRLIQENTFDPSKQVVIVVDPFEGLPEEGRTFTRNSPLEYLDFILHHRNATRGLEGELIFILYYKSGAWETISLDESYLRREYRQIEKLSNKLTIDDIIDRFKNYFTIHQDTSGNGNLEKQFQNIWIKVQREILKGKPLSASDPI
ncbi:toll/interleukin-1 receptor domain-containing protein [Chitinophaga sp. S165]|uniref:toll/interleukin-1 receptor domain-containing protein n=1 Tax=Chitinophaga sp. S165 TaxID=2135462 RepID=UPI000D713B98|nr:toll/interleukin-1 receptor domain-containing protein [Chitinophaga sp. S165]PWV56277.1 TIR domain-containing protein [Chitinophaga sp. S165]